MKKQLIPVIITGALLSPFIAWAVNVTVPSAPSAGYMLVSTSTGQYLATSTNPLYVGFVVATSTTQASVFPYASTTAISVSGLSNGNCVQASTGGLLTTVASPCGSGSGSPPFTPTTNYGVTMSATSTAIWARQGIYASSTSLFENPVFQAQGGQLIFFNLFSPTATRTFTFPDASGIFCLTTTCAPSSGILPSAISLPKGNFLVGNDAGVAQATSTIFITSTGIIGIGTQTPTDVNANSKLTVAGISSQDIIASTTDNTTLSDAILQAYACGSRVFIGAHGSNQVSTRYGLTLGGWSEIGAFNSLCTALPTNGLIVGTNPAVPIVFGTNNLERMRLTSAGALGINTTVPAAMVDIKGTTTDATAQALDVWNSVGATLLRVRNDGAVGIGTTSPSAGVFDVNGASYFSNAVGIGSLPATSTNPMMFRVATTSTVANTTLISGVFSSSAATGASNAMALTSTYTGAGDINITGLNSTITDNRTVICTQTINNGGCDRNRYVATNNAFGQRLASMAGITSKIQTQAGALSSTTIAVAFNAETPGIQTGNIIDNFYGLYVQGGTPAGGSVTLTNRYGVHADDLLGGMNQYAFDTAQNASTTCATCYYAFRATGTAPNYFAGSLGIGTTSPFSPLSLVSSATSIFAIATSTIAGSTNPIFEIDNTGHIITSGAKPTVSSCGSTNNISGNDSNGTIMFTGTLVTTCTLTFAQPVKAGATLECQASTNTTTAFADVSATSTTAVSFGLSAALSGGSIFYACEEHVTN